MDKLFTEEYTTKETRTYRSSLWYSKKDKAYAILVGRCEIRQREGYETVLFYPSESVTKSVYKANRQSKKALEGALIEYQDWKEIIIDKLERNHTKAIELPY